MFGLGEDTRDRIIFALAGMIGGLAIWATGEMLDYGGAGDRFPATVFVGVAGFFTMFMLLSGPISFLRAAAYAGGTAALVALLFLWASFRFETVNVFWESLHPFLACFLLIFLPMPFFVAREIAPGGWRDYEVLFDEAWAIAIRWIVSFMFCGAFWLVYALCSALLDLVGLDFLSALTDYESFVFSLSGLAIGLAISVLVERHTVVTTLRGVVQQLLRLLLPAIAAVVLIFILALPVQGLDRLFGLLSAAMTVLAMAMGSIKLITASVDNKDDAAARNPVLVWTSRALAVLLPVLPVIALYAIWLRVDQYGWSPLRICATVLAIILSLYAVLYALTQFKGVQWRQAVRSVNTYMALGIIGLAILWMTPLFHLERYAARDQVDRFIEGRTSLEDLDLVALWHDWGRAGRAAVEDLKAVEDHPEGETLHRMLAELEETDSAYDAELVIEQEQDTVKLEDVLAIIPVLPEGAEVPATLGESMSSYLISSLHTSCEMAMPDGRPSCALVVIPVAPGSERKQAFLFFLEYGDEDDLGLYGYLPEPYGDGFMEIYRAESIGPEIEERVPREVIADVLDGNFTYGPIRRNGLQFGETQVFTSN